MFILLVSSCEIRTWVLGALPLGAFWSAGLMITSVCTKERRSECACSLKPAWPLRWSASADAVLLLLQLKLHWLPFLSCRVLAEILTNWPFLKTYFPPCSLWFFHQVGWAGSGKQICRCKKYEGLTGQNAPGSNNFMLCRLITSKLGFVDAGCWLSLVFGSILTTSWFKLYSWLLIAIGFSVSLNCRSI